VKHFLVGFVVFLLWSLGSLYFYSCIIKEHCEQTETPLKVVNTYNSNAPLKNVLHETTIFKRIDSVAYTSKIDSVKNTFFQFLNKHQNQELIISGLYDSTETINLGLERAEDFKNTLVSYGINKNRIRVSAREAVVTFDSLNTASGGLLYDFAPISKQKTEKLEAAITNKILYAKLGSENFEPDNTLLRYALELKHYLEKYPNKTITVTGHTDNIGGVTTNYRLGLARAQHVKDYLALQNIPSEKINIASMGETQPIASNETPSGRHTNRRIEIKVTQQ
jgi:outer membrane protein OmpA-like peptidoglycan-associated protein